MSLQNKPNRGAAALWRLLLALVALSLPGRAQEAPLLPSEALHQMLVNMADNPGRQPATTRPLVPRIQTTGLSREERFALGEAYFFAFMPKEATEVFTPFLSGRDRYSRVAWQRHLQMVFRAYDRHDEAERLLAEFRKAFPAVAEDLDYSYQAVDNQARHFRDAGDHPKVVELVLADVNALPTDVPFSSFRLLIVYLPSFEAAGQKEAALQKMEAVARDLRAMLLRNNQPLPTEGRPPQLPRVNHPHKPGLVHMGNAGLSEDAPDFDPQQVLFGRTRGTIGMLEAALRRTRSAGVPTNP